MALLSFKEWRGQRGGCNPDHDKRKSGGRPKGTWVGGNPRYGKGGGDTSTDPKKNREFWKKHDQDTPDEDKCSCN